MFGRYFAPRYFARRYFGGSGEAAPAEPLLAAPGLTLRNRMKRVRAMSGERVRILESRRRRNTGAVFAAASDWILAAGVWNDAGFWRDTDVWQD